MGAAEESSVTTLGRSGAMPYVLKNDVKIPAGTDCILSHNPDSAAAQLTAPMLESSPLILAGHTHGGQVRLPGFGAVFTSSRFGKRFEYGAYRHAPTGAEMYVSAGIGATWFHARILCPPEVLLINFC